MTFVSLESSPNSVNPLDLIEEIVIANDWAFDRASADEMLVEVTGRWCSYRLVFLWHDEISALQLSCQFDVKVPPTRRPATYELLALMNERLWIGHFDIDSDELVPTYRHTTLYRGAYGVSVEQIEDLVDVALSECERFYPAFQLCFWGGKPPAEAISAAILDTVAEA